MGFGDFSLDSIKDTITNSVLGKGKESAGPSQPLGQSAKAKEID